jgi:hypothetical protein
MNTAEHSLEKDVALFDFISDEASPFPHLGVVVLTLDFKAQK